MPVEVATRDFTFQADEPCSMLDLFDEHGPNRFIQRMHIARIIPRTLPLSVRDLASLLRKS